MVKRARFLMMAMLALSAGSFAAEDRATASLKNISIELIDLDPLDAFAPAARILGPCDTGSPRTNCSGGQWVTQDPSGPLPEFGEFALPTYQSVSPHSQVLASPTEITVSASWPGTTKNYGASFEVQAVRRFVDYTDTGEYDGEHDEPGISLTPYTRMVLSGDLELHISDSCTDSSSSCYSRARASIAASDLGIRQTFDIRTTRDDPESLFEHVDFVVESGAQHLPFEFTLSLLADGSHPVTPVPEPGQWALMLCGLLVVASTSRLRQALRRSRQSAA